MQAEITESGTLRIRPENGLENFALEMWFKEYMSENNEKTVTLSIDTFAIDRGACNISNDA